MISPGSKVRVVGIPSSCCGAFHRGHECHVSDILYNWMTGQPDNILILKDGSLVWEHDVEEICE